ncbi:MAG: glycoside hydrolase family 3 protein [Alistipes sp.]|nr:glycoside hydrolase family 3 protein [Candidatus Alistipes equi]
MKTSKFFLIILFVLFAAISRAQDVKLTETNIDEIIKLLTLEEKAHLVVGTSLKGNDAARAEVGYTKKIVPGCAGTTYPIPRLGIPTIVMADGPAGLRISPKRENDSNTYYCTGFPVGSLLASTWNEELIEKVGKAMGEEVLEYGVDVLLAPGVNLHRNPLCGRNFEYYSEDPLLAGQSAAAFIRGIQSNGVGTSLKHFAANNQEINRLGNDSRIRDHALRELYLRNFEIAVKQSQPWTIMSSYNYINGRYASEDKILLEDILRNEWGFQGMVVSDWGGGLNAPLQIQAGNDMLQSGTYNQYISILEAVKSGKLKEQDLDKAVKRVLELIVKTPRFKGYKYSNKPDLKAHGVVSAEAAREGMVLLKNDSETLPLTEENTFAVFGTTSYDMIAGGLGSGDVHKEHVSTLPEALKNHKQNVYLPLEMLYAEHLKQEKKRIDKMYGKRSWQFYQHRPEEIKNIGEVAQRAAQNCSVALVTIGRHSSEGFDRHVERDFNIRVGEYNMLRDVYKAFHEKGKKVIVLLNVCGPVEMLSWRKYADAILLCWMPGGNGTEAITDLLLGLHSPSGRLSMTFPRRYADVPSKNFPVNVPETGSNQSFESYNTKEKYYDIPNIDYTNYEEDLMVGYRYYSSVNVKPAYPFGYGLSYTSFLINPPKIKYKDGIVKIECTIKNVGKYPSKEVVQIYSERCDSEGEYPLRELRSYKKTPLLQPMEQCVLKFEIADTEMSHFSEQRMAWVLSQGVHHLYLGTSSEELNYRMEFVVNKEKVSPALVSMKPKEGPVFLR